MDKPAQNETEEASESPEPEPEEPMLLIIQEEPEPTVERDIWADRFDTPRMFKLQPLETARVSLDFRDIPPGFEYNEHYAIVVLGRADDAIKDLSAVEKEAWQKLYEPDQDQQELPIYFQPENDEVVLENG